MANARIAFADGTVYRGRSVGAEGTSGGEAVFNTGMTGYQEVLTDPSYRGQIVTMTYPEIGNYGINPQDMESSGPSVAGFVMRHCCEEPSNFHRRHRRSRHPRHHPQAARLGRAERRHLD